MFHSVSCVILVSTSHSFDVNSGEIYDKTHTMILAIEKMLQDFISKQSITWFLTHQTSTQCYDGLKPNELLCELIRYMSNQTTITFIIDNLENENITIYNYLLIIDGYESFR